MKGKLLIFYAGLLHSVCNRGEINVASLGAEIYNGGYVYAYDPPLPQKIWTPTGWYRCDLTPVLDSDVPKELKTLLLLLL